MPLDLAVARQNMVEGQIRPNRVNDPRLLDAMESLPRELFVAAGAQPFAYSDTEVAASANRMLPAPMLLARMIEALDIKPNDNVLDVAVATGYSTALVAALARFVTGLEADAGLVTHAAGICQALKIGNVQFVHGPISMGAKQQAPYDAIIINGAMAEVPKTLFHQLAEGGRLVAVVGGTPGVAVGRVTLFTKFHGVISDRVLFESAASYVPGFAPHEEFSL
jgi:protein-L-isoaspartate(D-aspartate) O-methyltransferase